VAQCRSYLAMLGLAMPSSETHFNRIQASIVPVCCSIAMDMVNAALALVMHHSVAENEPLRTMFDGRWGHRRNSQTHTGVLMSAFKPLGYERYPVIDFKFVQSSIVRKHKDGTLIKVRHGNYNGSSQAMETVSFFSCMETIAKEARRCNLKIHICVDGDLSNAAALTEKYSDVVEKIVRDFGHFKKGVKNLLEKHFKANPKFSRLQGEIIRWLEGLIFQANDYDFDEKTFENYFLNLIEHFRNRHEDCPPKSTCKSACYQFAPDQQTLIAATDQDIQGLRNVLQSCLDLRKGHTVASNIRTSPVEGLHSQLAKNSRKDYNFMGSAQLREHLTIAQYQRGLTETVSRIFERLQLNFSAALEALLRGIDLEHEATNKRHRKVAEKLKKLRAEQVYEKRHEREEFPWEFQLNAISYGTSDLERRMKKLAKKSIETPMEKFFNAQFNGKLWDRCSNCKEFPAKPDRKGLCSSCYFRTHYLELMLKRRAELQEQQQQSSSSSSSPVLASASLSSSSSSAAFLYGEASADSKMQPSGLATSSSSDENLPIPEIFVPSPTLTRTEKALSRLRAIRARVKDTLQQPNTVAIVQRSPLWHELRVMCITSTRANAVLAAKGGIGQTLFADLLGATRAQRGILTKAMQAGIQQEPEILEQYREENKLEAFRTVVGEYWRHSTKQWITASPDAVIFTDPPRIIEIKCSKEKAPSKKWRDQLFHQMMVGNIAEGVLVIRHPETRTITKYEFIRDEKWLKWEKSAMEIYEKFWNTYLRWFWQEDYDKGKELLDALLPTCTNLNL